MVAPSPAPPGMEGFWEELRHAPNAPEMMAALAQQLATDYRAEGTVGPRPACLYVTRGGGLGGGDGGRTLRVDCFRNPEFWLEVDLDSAAAARAVRGRACTALYPGGLFRPGRFVLERRPGGGLRVTHTTCPAFHVLLTRASEAGV